MSTQSPEKKLTTSDPISSDVLKRMGQITAARSRLGDQLLDLEGEKIRLLVAARQLDDEKQRIFAKELTDRGIEPHTPVEVDAKTGQITFLEQREAADEETEAPQAQ